MDMPNHSTPDYPCQKGINASEWKMALNQLLQTGEFTSKWFAQNMPDCDSEGSCNFTTHRRDFHTSRVSCIYRMRRLSKNVNVE